jgi:hypothetical protein
MLERYSREAGEQALLQVLSLSELGTSGRGAGGLGVLLPTESARGEVRRSAPGFGRPGRAAA